MTIGWGDDMRHTGPNATRLRPSWRGGLLALLLTLVAGLVLAGCSAGGDDSASRELVEEMTAPEADVALDDAAVAGEGEAVTTQQTPPLVDRSVIYTVDLVVRVDDVPGASDAAQAIATRLGGYVQSEATYGSGDPVPYESDDFSISPAPRPDEQAVVVLRIPANRYDEATSELEAIGEPVSRNRNAQDVTDEVVDVQARIETQEASIDRLQTLLGEASKINDILAIETELTSRIAELESLKARQEQLASLTSMATITVTFVPPETVVEQGSGFVAGLRAGWDAFVRAVELGLTALGAVLPFLAAFALVVVPFVTWLVVRHRRRRQAAGPDVAAAAPASTSAPAEPHAHDSAAESGPTDDK